MIWQGSSLIDGPSNVAEATPNELQCGSSTLRLNTSSPADIRAVAPDGAAYRLHKAGLTVSRYRADCGGRAYALHRTSGKRREILDADGRVIARTRGLASGGLEVDPVPGLAPEVMLDLVFMSWALTFVDAPARRTVY
ncbi:hypothetical protein [Corynebacterium qintianiae]|uniref:hypothetical protein n=1 Tax=Corynebacterium qintianiae TaxID=2709392 RepID=UPI0013EB7AEE|nr:hypothetical protein [Corynebacterium qintianiae]